uniref:Histone-lysine N-methyltransferase, H3 lysine-79 specific-like n=1 Tax=Saccoglossus kowalevskii TaxID=10224 RepID=A0ABM0MVU1_SACKO|nr:PREDICTED: histone-lysine N-methyltransferase, H3 lysine-79 specific-like [Saccoglossus kowalevskii]
MDIDVGMLKQTGEVLGYEGPALTKFIQEERSRLIIEFKENQQHAREARKAEREEAKAKTQREAEERSEKRKFEEKEREKQFELERIKTEITVRAEGTGGQSQDSYMMGAKLPKLSEISGRGNKSKFVVSKGLIYRLY